MVVILKSFCFGVWLLMMLNIIKGTYHSMSLPIKEHRLYIDEQKDVEMLIRLTLLGLQPDEQLIIESYLRIEQNLRILKKMLHKNPSLLCINTEPDFI